MLSRWRSMSGNLHLGCDALHGVGVGEEVGVDFAVGFEVAAGERGDEDGFDVGGAGFFDVAAEVGFVLGHGGLAREMVFALQVVVAELNEHVVGFGLEAALPEALLAEGLGAGSAFGHVDAVDLGGEVGAEAAAVAGVVGLGGVADEVDADGGAGGADGGACGIEGAGWISLGEGEGCAECCRNEPNASEILLRGRVMVEKSPRWKC